MDNLPPQLLRGLVEMLAKDPHGRLAAVVDVRGGEFFQDLDTVVDDLTEWGIPVRLVFLDESNEVLVRRFEGTRRPHPLQRDGTLLEGITRERAALETLRNRADLIIDTSILNVHELREAVSVEVGLHDHQLTVNVVSFGYRNGIPPDADFVGDVRFLLNPHWVPALRPLTGLYLTVSEFVLGSEGAETFVSQYATLLGDVLALYRSYDKHSVTIAIGCTGGRHRSVAIAEALGGGHGPCSRVQSIPTPSIATIRASSKASSHASSQTFGRQGHSRG